MNTENVNIAQVSFNNTESLWETVYLHFGVYSFKDKLLLFEARKGPFASTAWILGDEVYNDILGSKFEAITGDDNCTYNLARNKIRRLESMQEFIELLNSENTCKSFRNQTIAWLYN